MDSDQGKLVVVGVGWRQRTGVAVGNWVRIGLVKGSVYMHICPLLALYIIAIARSYLRRHALPTDLSIGSV